MNHEPKLVRSQSQTAELLLGGNREAGEAAGFVLGLDENDSRFKLAMTSEAALGFWIGLSKAGEPCMANLVAKELPQSNESHAYPSRPFIAMSYFISFEPLIVPVSMLLPRCCLSLIALDETF